MYLRSSVGDERLRSLALIHVHAQTTPIEPVKVADKFALTGAHQGRSDGVGVYPFPISVQVNFSWGRNDVGTVIEHEYQSIVRYLPPPQKFYTSPKQIPGYTPGPHKVISCAMLSCFCRVVYFFILKLSLVMSCEFSIMSLASPPPGLRSWTPLEPLFTHSLTAARGLWVVAPSMLTGHQQEPMRQQQ